MYKSNNSTRRSSRKVSKARGQNSAIRYEKLEPKNLMTAIITEFLSSNNGMLTDDNGNSTDWIEIFNVEPDAFAQTFLSALKGAMIMDRGMEQPEHLADVASHQSIERKPWGRKE